MDGATFAGALNGGKAVTERGVKGQLLHKTGFGAAKAAGTSSFLNVEHMGDTIATFEYKYRSQGPSSVVRKGAPG